MDESFPPPKDAAPAVAPARMSFFARMLNVFAVPGEVFNEVRTSPNSVANWLGPVLLAVVVGIASVWVMFSQPTIQQQLHEQQVKAIDERVKAGKISRADADKGIAMMEKFTTPALMKIFGSLGVVMFSFVKLFWWAFVLWLMSRLFLKVPLPYFKSMEVSGLAMMISVLGSIVALLLVVNLGKMFAGPSLALAVQDFDVHRKSHVALGAANVFSFWYIGVMAMGLAKLTNAPFIRALFLVLSYWVLQEFLFIISGLGQFAL